MLIGEDGLRIEGSQSEVTSILFVVLTRSLEDAGYDRRKADALACRVVARVQARWAQNGVVVRHIEVEV